jgi:hypothetical protein
MTKKPPKKEVKPPKPKERIFPPAKKGGYVHPDPAAVPPPAPDNFD